jgi:hypothetical protein
MNGLPFQDAELKAEKYTGENPLMLEKLGYEKYVSKYNKTFQRLESVSVLW